MSVLDGLLVLLAAVGAGTINAVVGSGSLITFPTLLAVGYPPVLANISNNIGMVPGGLSGTWGYRAELTDQRRRLLTLATMSCLGGVTGALLLLVLPASSFRAVVPVLLAVAVLLVVVQPHMQGALARRRTRRGRPTGQGSTMAAMPGVALAGVYGGYFGGAQGVLLVGLLGTLLPESLQRVNALKNALATCVNAVAAVVFVVVARDEIDWLVVAVIAVGSASGGVLGATIGRRLPQRVLRAVIVVVGVVAIVFLVSPA
ncbi:sulfite exporter TauE/SafE family protein [Pseudonocardia nigra]|uniref:sulfite exporter TauE/SafE family protein n=1 Tax=Pseudonocardia nigra TaxID=1921578 RepID=UPI001C5D578A|nr:sulfite exporter TauE/SafE family protein [Pseudonocardia nigra]